MNPPSKNIINRDEDLLNQGESLVFKQIEGGPDLKAHIFLPPGEPTGVGRTAMVFFFGSGWDSGRVTQFAPHALHFASRGVVSVLIDYRTLTSHGASPIAAMMDARSAFRWVRYYSPQLGVNPNRIVGVGALAGANIAAATAMKSDLGIEETDPTDISGAPNALALFSPLIEVRKQGYGSSVFDETNTPYSVANLSAHIIKGIPPMVILHGTRDRLTPFSSVIKFANKMQRKKNICDLLAFEGRQHSFFNLNFDTVTYDHCNAQVERFLVALGFLPESPPIEGDGEEVRVVP